MATPPTKRRCCDRFSTEGSEPDDSDVIFPSDEESNCNDFNFFYPSEDSNQLLEQNSITDTTKDDAHILCSMANDNGFLYPSQGESVAANESQCSSLDCTLVETSAENEELERIGKLLIGVCCDKECLRYLTANDIITARTDFVQLTKSEQKQYLFTKLRENSSEAHHQAGKIETKFYIAGKEICSASWSKIYSISMRTLTRMLKDISFGENHVAHGNQGKKRVNTKKESVAAWMERYFTLIGDKMPDSKQIHLPSWETKKDIHARYCQDMQLRGIERERDFRDQHFLQNMD